MKSLGMIDAEGTGPVTANAGTRFGPSSASRHKAQEQEAQDGLQHAAYDRAASGGVERNPGALSESERWSRPVRISGARNPTRDCSAKKPQCDRTEGRKGREELMDSV